MPTASPLQWPPGWPRTEPHRRQDGSKFRRGDWRGGYREPTIAETSDELLAELRRFGARNVVISSNLQLRNDGLPRSGQRIPDDPGVAVYFEINGKALAMGRDLYTKPAMNIRALTRVIEAMRLIDREGGSTMLQRAFQGFEALPAPGSAHWSAVLQVSPSASAQQIRDAYRKLAKERHPDRGGSEAAMAELNRAHREAAEEVGGL